MRSLVLLIFASLAFVPARLDAQGCPVPGIQWSRPIVLSVGVSCVRHDPEWRWQPMSSLEVGTAGAKAMLGAARLLHGEMLYSQQLKVGLMRTWGEPWHARANELYAGLELRWGIGFTAGPSVFYRISEPERSGRWMGGWTVGFWF